MTPAYDKVYLEKAQTNLGRMLDFAVYDLEYDLTKFFDMFIRSGLAERFGRGDYSLISGMSGVELAYLVLEKSGHEMERVQPRYSADRSDEYWTGWALAYYQWERALSFEEIIRRVPMEEIRAFYSPYHEMDVRQFRDKMDDLLHTVKK